MDLLTRRRDIRKGPFMCGVKIPFHRYQICSVSQVPNRMYIARKRGDERSHEVVPHSQLPLEGPSWKVDYNIIRIVGENFVFIGTFPGIEIFLNESANISRCHLDGCVLHDLAPFSTL